MGFYSNAAQFYGQRVVNFDPEKGIEALDVAYRFYTDYDGEHDVPENLKKFIDDDKAGQISALVIGMWDEEHDSTPDTLLDLLIQHKDQLQSLKAIFVGDISQEENEVSWIENTSYHAFLNAFPLLEFFQVRGGNGLSLGVLDHPNLKKLVLETGGMGNHIFSDLSESELPALEHLELWLGSDNYGFSASPTEVVASYRGDGNDHFPSLRYLGLCNSEIADQLAEKLLDDPILQRLEVLDLSNGTLSDEGAEALLDNTSIKNLKELILDHHYISEELQEQLKDLGIAVSLDDPQEEENYDGEIYRYIAVAE
jgi:hypothetical protein